MADPPRRGGGLATLQAGRGLAALLVVLCHATIIFADVGYWHVRIFGNVFGFGYAGVEFFFVLSGFIMVHAHRGDIGRPATVRAYLTKRFLRVYPVYWLVSGAVLVAYVVAGKQPLTSWVGTVALLGPSVDALLPVAWTLFHEVVFYLLFALLLVGRRFGSAVLLAWFAACLWWFGRTPPHYALAATNLLFGFGIVAAVAWPRLAAPRAVLVVAVAAFVAIGLDAVYGDTLGGDGQRLAFGAAAALGIAAAARAEQGGRLVPPRALVALGDASYALYLIHPPLLIVVAKLWCRLPLDRLPAEVAFPIVVGGVVVAAIIFHRAVERPLLHRLRRMASP